MVSSFKIWSVAFPPIGTAGLLIGLLPCVQIMRLSYLFISVLTWALSVFAQ